MMSGITWYDVLGVLPDAPPEDIRAAWQARKAALQPAAQRAQAPAELTGCFILGFAFEITQNERRLIAARQPADLFIKNKQRLSPRRLGYRIRPGHWPSTRLVSTPLGAVSS